MTKKKERKTQSRFVYEGFGFPVTLLKVPMVKIRGAWTPDVNYEHLQEVLLVALAEKPARLSGDEVKFIRHSLEMTLQAFGERFQVTHPAVLKWEARKKKATGMNWATEKDIRLHLLERAGAKPVRFVKLYKKLEEEPRTKPKPLRLDVSEVA